MSDRPANIGHYETLLEKNDFTYRGSEETFADSARVGERLGLQRVGVNLDVLRPGKRTSWPHAHKVEEEFVFVLEGHPTLWQDGEVYELNPGDGVAFPAGSGIAHTFINNTDEDIHLLVIGENRGAEDGEQLIYPRHPQHNERLDREGYYWRDNPKNALGPHDGFPDDSEFRDEEVQKAVS